MKLAVLPGEFAVARLAADAPVPGWAAQGGISSVTRTADELSVVCAAAAVPPGERAERGWRCLRVVGRLDFAMTGVVSAIASPLAQAKVSVFVISTYDTDYVLVRQPTLDRAIACLRDAGHEVLSDG